MKNLIDWTDELSVDIQEIDEQHKILVDLLNRLHEAIMTRTQESVVNDILTELVEYTIIHFTVEESLMRIFDYPLYEEHKKLHEDLTEEVVDLKNKVKESEFSASMDLWKFLRSWLMKHIIIEDKKYSRFFLEKGLGRSWAKQQSWGGKIWKYMRMR